MANMAMHVVGNLTGEVNFRAAENGKDAMAFFSIAWNKGKDREGKEIPPVFLDLSVFGQDAENLKASGITKGHRIIAIIEPRPYEQVLKVVDPQTNTVVDKKITRTGYRVLEIGPSTKFAVVSGIAKNAPRGQGAGNSQADFANAAPAQQAPAPAQAPVPQQAPAAAAASGYPDSEF